MTRRANNTRILVSLSSKDEPPYCGHRGNAGECEQWSECAAQQDKKGFPPIAWFAAYPGTSCEGGSVNVSECQIERPSRPCDAEEKAADAAAGHDPSQCARPNGFFLVDLVGQGGGEEGVRAICTLPPAYVGSNRMVRAQTFSYSDWRRTRNGDGWVPVMRRGAGPIPRTATAFCRSWNFTRGGAEIIQ